MSDGSCTRMVSEFHLGGSPRPAPLLGPGKLIYQVGGAFTEHLVLRHRLWAHSAVHRANEIVGRKRVLLVINAQSYKAREPRMRLNVNLRRARVLHAIDLINCHCI